MENSTLGPNPPPIEMEKNKVIFIWNLTIFEHFL